ncbi:hypothetical protein EYF80_053241 [Liparis tanakae]|uniref:Uncharacterized protein n=1 Tax=Liparis tanakae TaxID=230148 RepID=A0A4Z2F728_9TELE|nr:hypothetical protein EYF80_053241 [Liparis tanakae]
MSLEDVEQPRLMGMFSDVPRTGSGLSPVRGPGPAGAPGGGLRDCRLLPSTCSRLCFAASASETLMVLWSRVLWSWFQGPVVQGPVFRVLWSWFQGPVVQGPGSRVLAPGPRAPVVGVWRPPGSTPRASSHGPVYSGGGLASPRVHATSFYSWTRLQRWRSGVPQGPRHELLLMDPSTAVHTAGNRVRVDLQLHQAIDGDAGGLEVWWLQHESVTRETFEEPRANVDPPPPEAERVLILSTGVLFPGSLELQLHIGLLLLTWPRCDCQRASELQADPPWCSGVVGSWKTWKSHGILKWSFPGLEDSWNKLKS